MNYSEFLKYVKQYERPVILVEGTRKLPDSDRPKLVELGKTLAKALPMALFRTGNAKGSDEAFAEGIQQIDPTRLQYILPYQKHRKDSISGQSYQVALTEISSVAEEQAVYLTKESSPEYSSLLEKRNKIPLLKAKARYILRDTIKVTGVAELSLRPATLGIFYLNPENPMQGGTAHTVRVCRKQKIPVITQDEWMAWE